jgi:hypothetical protein
MQERLSSNTGSSSAFNLSYASHNCGFGKLEDMLSGNAGKYLVSLKIRNFEGLERAEDLKGLETCTNLELIDIQSSFLCMEYSTGAVLDLRSLGMLQYLRFNDRNGHSHWKDTDDIERLKDEHASTSMVFLPPETPCKLVFVWNQRSHEGLSDKLRDRLRQEICCLEEWVVKPDAPYYSSFLPSFPGTHELMNWLDCEVFRADSCRKREIHRKNELTRKQWQRKAEERRRSKLNEKHRQSEIMVGRSHKENPKYS